MDSPAFDFGYVNRLPKQSKISFTECSSDLLVPLADALLCRGRLRLADCEHLVIDLENAAVDEDELREHLQLLERLNLAFRVVERSSKRAVTCWLSTLKGGVQ